MADRQYLPLAEPFPAAETLQPPQDTPVVVRRPIRLQPDLSITPILDAQPIAVLAPVTIVAGTFPCAMIPSGMTPGDDANG